MALTLTIPSEQTFDSAPREDELYTAAMIGLRDYVGKNGFQGVVLGLSGGVDSALAAALAVDALGAAKVRAVLLPSPYTSQESLEDAAKVAGLLRIVCDVVSIKPLMQAANAALAPIFSGREADVTEENIQSRLRGMLLMAISNKLGLMVLTTGNKSEMSVGYATLYGDMCGGYNPLKDLYKTDVWALAEWRNEHLPVTAMGPAHPVMPQRVISKPPSAELRANQKDEDSLPAYPILDALLRLFIEEHKGLQEVLRGGEHPEDDARKVWQLLQRAEYKRRQAPPGVKVSPRAFGRDWRFPITNGYSQ